MINRFRWAGLGLLLLGAFCSLHLHQQNSFLNLPLDEQKTHAARRIIQTFEKHSHELSLEKKGHFYLRLYRITGEAQYIPPVQTYAKNLIPLFQNHAANLHSDAYIQQTAFAFLKLPEKPLVKHVYRSKVRNAWPEMTIAHRLLFLMFQIKSFGLKTDSSWEAALNYLHGLPYEKYLQDEDVIRYNTSRAVNMVYQIKFLGIGDYEKEFTDNFKKVFSQPDQSLNAALYLNKIYGLTHFVIAASDFYQHPVPEEKFKWILDYFSENTGTLLIRNTPDTAAEIAVCFKLAGRPDDPAVAQIQHYLLRRWNRQKGVLPLEREAALNRMEHRNILAVMALSDWKNLYAGPKLE